MRDGMRYRRCTPKLGRVLGWSIVFSHPVLGTPLDGSKITSYAKKAYARARITKAFRPWHGLRHTALTETAASGVPSMLVQAKAGHAQAATTERYLHANKTNYPNTAELAEARMFEPEHGLFLPELLDEEAGTNAGTN
jgi:integrase